MPASSTISSAPSPDNSAARAICTFQGKYPGPKSYCKTVTLQLGEQASTGTIVIPLAILDSVVPAISGTKTSPVELIQHDDIAIVTAQLVPQLNGTENPADGSTTVLSGRVRQIFRNIGLDQAIITVKDHRECLEGLPIVGSFWSQIRTDGDGLNSNVAYRQGVKAHINPGNQPNCLFVSVTQDDGADAYLPMFCTPFFGHQDFKTTQVGTDYNKTTGVATNAISMTIPKPGSIGAQTSSCYWTPATLWQHYQWATSVSAKDIAQANGNFQEFASLDSASGGWITWPVGLETAFIDNNPQSSKAWEKVFHCYKLLPLLHEICQVAGPYDIYMHSEDDGRNTLNIVRTRYTDNQSINGDTSNTSTSNDGAKGIILNRAIGGNASADMTGPTIIGGHLSESSENLYHVTEPVGEHPFIELRAASAQEDGTIEDHYFQLIAVFTQSDFDNATESINTHYNKIIGKNAVGRTIYGDEVSVFLPGVFKQYDVCASYQLFPGDDFQIGTSQAGFPVAAVARSPLGTLLSSYVQSFASDEFGRQNSRYEIVVETNSNNDDISWKRVDNHGLKITGDGTLSFADFRDSEATGSRESTLFYRIEKTGVKPDIKAVLKANRVRITLAVPCDHRLTATVGLAGLSEIPVGDTDTDDTSRMNLSNGVRTLAIDTGALLAFEERSTQFPPYPIPQSLKFPNKSTVDENGIPTTTNYPAAGDQSDAAVAIFGDAIVLRNDTQYAINQANRKLREFGRLDRSGELVSDRIDLGAEPGQMIDQINNSDGTNFPVKALTSKVIHNFDAPQSTKRQLV